MNLLEEAEKALSKYDLKQFVKKSYFWEEEVVFGKIIWKYECENDNWKWVLNLHEDIDSKPGVFEIYNLEHKMSCFSSIKYFGDLFCQNTSEAVLNNFLTLIWSQNLEDYFQNRFGKVLELEERLKDDGFEISIPYNMLDLHPNLNECFFCLDTYRIVVSSKGKEVCNIIPSAFEPKYDTHGKYNLFLYPSTEKVGEMGHTQTWSYNYRHRILFETDICPLVFEEDDYESLAKGVISFLE